MDPIINPWIFYWANTLQNIRDIISVTLFILIAVICILGITIFINEEECAIFSILKRCIISSCILAIVLAIIPNKTTIYEMATAFYVTPNNISAVEEDVTDFISDIVSAIEEQESDK